MLKENFPPEKVEQVLDALEEAGVKAIDTATIYQESEAILGESGASSRFTIDTKYPGGFGPEPSTQENILAVSEQSLKALQTDQVDVYYIHSPDRRVPLEELLAGINALHQAGKFKRFGLSNFLAEEVEEVVRIAREKNYILPSVYQGNYNAVARRQETELIPTLRKHNIAFYAYSPIAGGFLTKDVEQLVAGGEGRWDPSTFLGQMYHALYNKPTMLEGLRLWEAISKESGVPKAELAYRWVTYHSALKGDHADGVVFGSSNVDQLKNTLAGVKNGPLAPEVAKRIDEVWKIVEADSPLDNFNSLPMPEKEKSEK